MLACGRALVGNADGRALGRPGRLLVRDLGRVLGALKAAGAAILLVEQNLAFALRVADYVYLLSKGRIVHGCLPEELRGDDVIKARYLGV
jgi:branched-chain amino acid transport system ATP-binding protein